MMSESPPPVAAGFGLRPLGETMWKLAPESVDLATKPCAVLKPHGPDSQMLPAWSICTSGSPSVRCGSTIVAGAKLIPPVGNVGLGTGPPLVKARLAEPVYDVAVTRKGVT